VKRIGNLWPAIIELENLVRAFHLAGVRSVRLKHFLEVFLGFPGFFRSQRGHRGADLQGRRKKRGNLGRQDAFRNGLGLESPATFGGIRLRKATCGGTPLSRPAPGRRQLLLGRPRVSGQIVAAVRANPA